MIPKCTIIASSGGAFGEHRDTYYGHAPAKGLERYPLETGQIDRLILQASGKKDPKVCCIMTASHTVITNIEELENALKRRFGELGAEVETMRLTYYSPDDDEVKARIEAADVIYVSGGVSYNLAQTLKHRSLDKLLAAAAARGAVLSGLSAGLCCWFSDVNAVTNGTSVSRVSALGWFKALIAPHWENEPHRHKPFHQMLMDDPGLVGLAFDERTAIEIRDDKYRLHQFDSGGKVHRGQYDKSTGYYSFEALEMSDDFKPLSDLGIEARPQ